MLPTSQATLEPSLVWPSLRTGESLYITTLGSLYRAHQPRYYLATSANDSVVKLWDLRKLKNFKSINLEEGSEVTPLCVCVSGVLSPPPPPPQVLSLCFDQTGTYLAVAGTNIQSVQTH